MNILRRLFSKTPVTTDELRKTTVDVRPLSLIMGMVPLVSVTTAESIVEMLAMPDYSKVLSYFSNYPTRSMVSANSRAFLFTLIRAMHPKVVAEVGTLYAGTTEVIARAVCENGGGIIHTTDPFDIEQRPEIIASWPQALRDVTRFHALNSMDFFLLLDGMRVTLGLVLIDGNHEYEFVLFDLRMAAKLLRPGGIIVMNNAEQSGPFRASQEFLAANATWYELGRAIASHNPSLPFDTTRASLPDTTFIVLKAPNHIPVGEGPHSWGQTITNASRLDGFTLELSRQITAGTLHYQAILRAFPEGEAIVEVKTIGCLRLNLPDAATVEHKFSSSLYVPKAAHYTYEFDFSWQADADSAPLSLAAIPAPIAG
jgi:predicted O-methyltransferase YrrM